MKCTSKPKSQKSILKKNKSQKNIFSIANSSNGVVSEYADYLLVEMMTQKNKKQKLNSKILRLAVKRDKLNQDYEEKVKFTSGMLNKLDWITKENEELRRKISLSNNLTNRMQSNLVSATVNQKDKQDEFYQVKMDELRKLYRKSLSHKLIDNQPVKEYKMSDSSNEDKLNTFQNTLRNCSPRFEQKSAEFKDVLSNSQVEEIKKEINHLEERMKTIKIKQYV